MPEEDFPNNRNYPAPGWVEKPHWRADACGEGREVLGSHFDANLWENTRITRCHSSNPQMSELERSLESTFVGQTSPLTDGVSAAQGRHTKEGLAGH